MFKFTLNCLGLFFIFVNMLIVKTFNIHSEPNLAESLLQQERNHIFAELTVAVNDEIQDCCPIFTHKILNSRT